jgi:hypothetical protein
MTAGTVCSGTGGVAAPAGVVEKVEGTDTGLAAGPGSTSSGFDVVLDHPWSPKL